MDRDSMKKTIAEELERIPRREDGSLQNIFRSAYESMREHDLSKDPATLRRVTFDKALQAIRKSAPDFSPECDKRFFGY